MSFFGAPQQQRDSQRAVIDQFANRNATAENSSRLAQNTFTYTTTGVGEIVVKQPIMFDCTFIQEPSFTSGVYIASAPDTSLYRYPLVTAGVYRWVEELQKPQSYRARMGGLEFSAAPPVNNGVIDAGYQAQIDALKDSQPKFYKGAYLYYVVRVDPIQTPRSDGSNLVTLQRLLQQSQVGGSNYVALQANIKEAQLALKLAAHPARVRLHHHLQFSGVAMKKLTPEINALSQDTQASPTTQSNT